VQPWWEENPSVPDQYCLPTGKDFGDLWSSKTDAGKANTLRLPKVLHHKSGKLRPLCAKYTIQGKCKASCGFSHQPPGDMNPALRRQTDEAVSAAYT